MFKRVVLFLATFVVLIFTSTKSVEAAVDVQCVGKGVAKYMNAVVAGAGNLQHVKLLSPAFNISDAVTIPIVKVMSENGANFGGVVAIAGNAYNNPEVGSIPDQVNAFLSGSGLGGKNVFLTETGNYGTTDLNALGSQLSTIKSDNKYVAALLYNAFGTNRTDSFTFSDGQLTSICSGDCGKVGVNAANYYTQPAGFYERAQSHGMKFTLEIAKNDVGNVMTGLRAANGHGETPTIRIGIMMDSGGFTNPQDYVNFLKAIDAAVDANGKFTVYAIAGPNEPETELWATPECQEPQTAEDEIPCNQTSNSEFHNLRPYPHNPCKKKVEEVTLSCGNDLYTKKGFEVTKGGGMGCSSICDPAEADGSQVCKFQCDNVKTRISVDLSKAELPIAGNTELVPHVDNGQAVTDNALTSAQRLNQYVSWYLNGAVYPPYEEDIKKLVNSLFQNNTDYQNQVVNFSGPLRKLLPLAIQTTQRILQANDAVHGTDIRHNQTFLCSTAPGIDALIPCTSGGAKTRLSDLLFGVSNYFAKKYEEVAPSSSTEDRKGQTEVQSTQSDQAFGGAHATNVAFTLEDSTDRASHNLYFAHMQEDAELAKLLQGTFASLGQSGYTTVNSDGKSFPTKPHCEIVDSRTNSGDRLYGNYNNPNSNDKQIAGTISYNASFTCKFGPPPPPTCILTGTCTQTCKQDVYAGISVLTKTPKIEEIWQRLVDGPASVFKRFFPKVGANSPLTEIKDLPTLTNASYNSTSPGVETLAGDPSNGKSGADAQLVIPHLGGVQEYFLKGIQKALRPKGFGEDIAGEPLPSNPPGPGVVKISPGLSGYFESLKDTAKTFNTTASFCGLTYVSPSDAAHYADKLRTSLPTQKGFWESYFKGYLPSETQNLFASCGGTNCLDFILNTVENTPICNGNVRLNPYVAVAIALNETGGLRNQPGTQTNQHFGCTMSSFSAYIDNGQAKTSSGLTCTVQTADGRQVINPMIGPPISQDDFNKCVPQNAQATWQSTRFNTTVEDGLACMISRFNAYCRSDLGNRGDVAALNAYGYGSLENIYGNVIKYLLRNDNEGLFSKFANSCNF